MLIARPLSHQPVRFISRTLKRLPLTFQASRRALIARRSLVRRVSGPISRIPEGKPPLSESAAKSAAILERCGVRGLSSSGEIQDICRQAIRDQLNIRLLFSHSVCSRKLALIHGVKNPTRKLQLNGERRQKGPITTLLQNVMEGFSRPGRAG